jgi:hypothetical protein
MPPSAAFSLNGGAPGAKLSIAAAGTVTAELDDLSGVRYVEWEIVSTDETTEPADYTLSVTAGAIPGAETTTFTAGAAGTAGILRARINNGRDLQTGETEEAATTSTAKWFVPSSGSALEVGAARENDQSDSTFGWTGIVNSAIRATAAFAGADADPTPDTILLRGASGEAKAVWYTDGSANVATVGLIRTANNFVAVAARNAGNTADITVLSTNASNHIVIGEATDCVRVVASVATGGVFEVLVNSASATTVGADITMTSTSGKLRIGGVDAVTLAGGGLTYASDSVAGTNYRTASGQFHTWYVDNVAEMTLGAAGLTLLDPVTALSFTSTTGTPAGTGLLRSEKNTTAVAFRNDGNTADIRAVRMGATNHLLFGDSSEVVNTEHHVKAAGEHRFYVDSTLRATVGAAGIAVPGAGAAVSVAGNPAITEAGGTLVFGSTTGSEVTLAGDGPSIVRAGGNSVSLETASGGLIYAFINGVAQVTIAADEVGFRNNVSVGAANGSYGSAAKAMFIANGTAPSSNPTGGVIIYAEAGAAKVRGSGGTITTFGPAEPHCPKCKDDFVVDFENGDKRLSICFPCLLGALAKSGIQTDEFAFRHKV